MIKLLSVITVAMFMMFGCTAEDIGSRLDPKFDEYIKNRSFQQKIEDEKKGQQVQDDLKNNKKGI